MSDRCPVCGRMVGPDEPCFHPQTEQPINTLARLVMHGLTIWLIVAFVGPVLLLVLFLGASSLKALLLVFGVPALTIWGIRQLTKKQDQRRQRRREQYQKRVSNPRTPPEGSR